MKDAWFAALCAIALFKIIEAKPTYSYGGYADSLVYNGLYGDRSKINQFDDYSGIRFGDGICDHHYGARGIIYNYNCDGMNFYGRKGYDDIPYGSVTYGYDESSDRGRRPGAEEIDSWSYLKPSCSGLGCKRSGNPYQNTNSDDIVSKQDTESEKMLTEIDSKKEKA